MKRACFYHAGCPDGFGAAWAAHRAWGDGARYVARRHEHVIDPEDYRDFHVAYLDIAPSNEELRVLSRSAEHVVVLDHHVSARDRYLSDPPLVNAVEELGHEVHYDMGHSGAVLSWQYFCTGEPPELLRYVEDQDLWSWRLPLSREVNAALAAYPYLFETWDELASRPMRELAAEGQSIVRANRAEVERRVRAAHPLLLDGRLIEAVNATTNRSAIGHELAERKAYGVEWGCVYRLSADRVHATLYSIGEVNVAELAARLGGGGHRNAAGFNVSLRSWLADFVEPAR